MQKIFLAFPGYQVTLKQKIKKIGDFEFWNLEKIKDDEFISLIQKKIRPFNKNVKKYYFFINILPKQRLMQTRRTSNKVMGVV